MRRLRGELWPAQSQQGLHIPQGLLDYAGLDGKIQILASDGKIQIVLDGRSGEEGRRADVASETVPWEDSTIFATSSPPRNL